MRWRTVHITASGPPTVLELDGVPVVRLMDRVDGGWFALLDYHLGSGQHRSRECTSYESGRRGAELWAQRHMERLQREAVAERERWARLPVGEGSAAPRSAEEIEAERLRELAFAAVSGKGRRWRRRR